MAWVPPGAVEVKEWTPPGAKEVKPFLPAEFVKGIARGVERLPQGVGALGEMTGELTGIEQLEESGRKLKEFFARETLRGWEAPHPYSQGPLKDHPVVKSAAIVGEALPYLGAALLTSGAAAAAGATPAAASWIGAGTVGFGLGTPQTYLEAREKEASKLRALGSGLASGLGETVLEFFPMNYIFRGGMAPGFRKAMLGAIGEGAEEFIQQLWGNAIAKVGYDKTRDLYEGVIESTIGGIGAGGVAGAVMEPINVAKAEKKIKAFREEATKAGIPTEQQDVMEKQIRTGVMENTNDILYRNLRKGIKIETTEEGSEYIYPDSLKGTEVAKSLDKINKNKSAIANNNAFNQLRGRTFAVPDTIDVMGTKGRISIKVDELPADVQGWLREKAQELQNEGVLDEKGNVKLGKGKQVYNAYQLVINQHLPNTIYTTGGGWLEDARTNVYFEGKYVPLANIPQNLINRGLLTIENEKVKISPDLKVISNDPKGKGQTISTITAIAQNKLSTGSLGQPTVTERPTQDEINTVQERINEELKKQQDARDRLKEQFKITPRQEGHATYDLNVKEQASAQITNNPVEVVEGKVKAKETYHVARTDRRSRRIIIDKEAINNLWIKYQTGVGIFPEGIIEIPQGLTKNEFDQFVVNHERVHLETGLDGSVADENMVNVLALEKMGRGDLAGIIEARLGFSTTLPTPEIKVKPTPAEILPTQERIDISASRKKSPYFYKDKTKFSKANKLIARGSANSSSEAYRVAVGNKANTGLYTSSDAVGISTEGDRRGRIGPDFAEIQRAVDADVTFITDNKADRARQYNVGEREVAEYISKKGYVETASGVWKRDNLLYAASKIGMQPLVEPVPTKVQLTAEILPAKPIEVELRKDKVAITDITRNWLEAENLLHEGMPNTLLGMFEFINKLDDSYKNKWKSYMEQHDLTYEDMKEALDERPSVYKLSKNEYYDSKLRIALSPLAQELVEARRQLEEDLAYTSQERYVEWKMRELSKDHTAAVFNRNEGKFRIMARNEWADLAKAGKQRALDVVQALHKARLDSIAQRAIEQKTSMDELEAEVYDNETAAYEPVKEDPKDSEDFHRDMQEFNTEIKDENEKGSVDESQIDDYFPAKPQGPTLETAEMSWRVKVALLGFRLRGKTQADFEAFMGEPWVRGQKEIFRQKETLRRSADIDGTAIEGAYHYQVNELKDLFRLQMRDLAERSVLENAKTDNISFKDKAEEQGFIKAKMFAMFFAGEEIRTGNDPKKYNVTDKGADRKFRPPELNAKGKVIYEGERPSFIEAYKQAVGLLRSWYPNLPTDVQIDALTRHPKAPFFNLLNNADKALMTWGKSQIENILLAELIQWNMIDTTTIHQKAVEGWMHRPWELTPQQRSKAQSLNDLKAKEFQAQRWWSAPEFYIHSVGEGIIPKPDYAFAMGNYIYQVMSQIDQQRYFKLLKAVPHPDYLDLAAVQFEGDPLPGMGEIDSDTGKSITWQKRALQLGYRELKAATGLVKWTRGIFKPPYVYEGLADKLESILTDKATSQPLNKLIRATGDVNTFFKKYIVMLSPQQFLFQILSSSWLYMSPIMAWKYGGIKALTTFEAFRKGPELGLKVLRGEISPMHFVDQPTYDPTKMRIFLQYGIMRNPAKRVKQFFDVIETSESDPLLRSQALALKEYITGKLGLDQYAFGEIMTKAMYYFADVMVQQTMKREGITSYEEAAKFIAPFISDAMGTPHPSIYGEIGPLLQGLFFARDFTFTALRQFAGALGIHMDYQPTGGKHWLNVLAHGEISKDKAQRLQGYYIRQLGKTMMAKLLFVALAQYALSSLWRKRDEKPTFPFQNPPGKKLLLETPWEDEENRRVYIDTLMWREFQDLIEWLSPGKQLKGKLSFIPRQLIEQFSNEDWSGMPITGGEAIPFPQRVLDRSRHAIVSMLPSAARPDARHMKSEWVSLIAGMPIRKGLPIMEGMTPEMAYGLRAAAQRVQYQDEQARKLLRGLRPGDKKALDLVRTGRITPQAYAGWVERYKAPQAQYMERRTLREFFR